jgi:fructosamine-3-kinase
MQREKEINIKLHPKLWIHNAKGIPQNPKIIDPTH